MSDYFYGWYYRCQGADGILAVIPAVHLSEGKSSCSIQMITQAVSLYREFPAESFRINRKRGILQIGENLFTKKGIRLDFQASSVEKGGNENACSGDSHSGESITVRGTLRFGRFAEPKYDIMGPFALISGMECRHAVYSMRHTVNGAVSIGKEQIRFENGAGYMEGDSGTSFPDKYVWTQHFLTEGSFMLAAASIPLAGMHFTGTVGFLFYKNREYRFATYLGASVTRMRENELMIRQGRFRIRVRFPEQGGRMLKAPECGQMTRRVRENIACRAEYTVMYGRRVLLHTVTGQAASECDTKEENNEDNSNHSGKDKRKIFEGRYRRIQQAAEPLL